MVFIMTSSISVALFVKVCDISIKDVVRNPAVNILFILLNSFHNIGKKKPKGINSSTFRQALAKSDTIYAKGITFTVNLIFIIVAIPKQYLYLLFSISVLFLLSSK